MTKVDSKKQLKLQSLLDSAFALFNENGFGQTSIADIVERAGVAKGTFYLYFQDKNDILNRVIVNKAGTVFHLAYKKMEAENIVEFEDQVIFLIDDILEQLKNNKKLLALISKNLSSGLFRKFFQPTHDKNSIEDTLGLLVSGSNHVYKDPITMLYIIVELVSGTAYSVILRSQPMSLEELKPPLFESVRAIMRTFQED